MISRIKSTKIRNIVRGVTQASSNAEVRQTLKTLRLNASAEDSYLAYDYLYENPLNKTFSFPDAFPETPASFLQNVYFEPISFIRELGPHRVLFEKNQDQLLKGLMQLKIINENILQRDANSLKINLVLFSESFGFSLIFLKKLISIKHSTIEDEQLSAIVQANIQKYLQHYRRIAVKAFEDSVDDNTEYPKVRETFISYIKGGYIKDSADKIILEDYFNPLINSAHKAAERLQAFSCFSCLDSIIFLLSNETQIQSVLTQTELLIYQRTIPIELRNFYKNEFGAISIEEFSDLLESSERFKEYSFFRHSSNFYDIPCIYSYRLNIEKLAAKRLGSLESYIDGNTRDLSIDINPINIKKFVTAQCSEALNISRIDPQVCGNFHRAIYLVWMIENKVPIEPLSGNEFLRLLDITVDVAKLLKPTEIMHYFPNAERNTLHNCLSSALINDSTKSDRTEHRLRKSLQTILREDHDNSVINFINYLHEETPHVAQYFFFTSSEAFLTKLYDIFKNSSEVIETKCDLLMWYSEKFDCSDSYNRAQSLKLDLKLQAVRGDIDDNRIIVDHARFMDWMSENVLSDLRNLASSYAHDETYKSNADGDIKNPVAVIQNPNLKLASILDKCFQEFCTNKNYGVESYIGRRIRHGSLEGTMLSDIQGAIRGYKLQHAHDLSFEGKLETWVENYKNVVKHIGDDLLQINSKSHKQGRIIAGVTCNNKKNLLKNFLNEVEPHLRKEDVFKVLDYIYFYCWLFLETDLNILREELTRTRSSLIIEHDENDRDRIRFIRNINSLTEAKFEKLSVWLKKPNNVSPTASLELLFRAVIKDARERHLDFSPQLTMQGDCSIDLHGHGYHFFYDILEILVNNAAQHGKKSGKVLFSFTETPSGSYILKITSEVDSTNDLKEKIDALFDADIADAMSASKNSGIKKLRVLQRDIKEIRSISYQINDSKKEISAICELDLQRN